eukprot:COSAG01_NODE_33791_length_558_cov_1.575163_2_plen_50_part_01
MRVRRLQHSMPPGLMRIEKAHKKTLRARTPQLHGQEVALLAGGGEVWHSA